MFIFLRSVFWWCRLEQFCILLHLSSGSVLSCHSYWHMWMTSAFCFYLKTHRCLVPFVIAGNAASAWISEIKSSSYFGSGKADDHLSAVQQGYNGNEGPRLLIQDKANKGISTGGSKDHGTWLAWSGLHAFVGNGLVALVAELYCIYLLSGQCWGWELHFCAELDVCSCVDKTLVHEGLAGLQRPVGMPPSYSPPSRVSGGGWFRILTSVPLFGFPDRCWLSLLLVRR